MNIGGYNNKKKRKEELANKMRLLFNKSKRMTEIRDGSLLLRSFLKKRRKC
jgi:hypothetical protein